MSQYRSSTGQYTTILSIGGKQTPLLGEIDPWGRGGVVLVWCPPLEASSGVGRLVVFVRVSTRGISHHGSPEETNSRGRLAFSAGRPCVVPLLSSNTASSSAISVVQWW